MKKTIYAVLPLLVALVMFWTGAGNEEAKVSMAAETLGDVTSDGTINQDDMDALVNHLLQGTEVDETNANVDAEEGLDVRDVMRYQRYIYYQTVDTSWFDTSKSEFTIENGQQLYGLAKIVKEGAYATTLGKTFTLADDVIINARGCDWKTPGMSFANEGLVLSWTPIGTSSQPFRGNFNGGGHTIAGIYTEGTDRQGLFGAAFRSENKGGNIGNFDLKDTYIKSTGAFNGSVVGIFRGNITSVYSDATIEVDCSGGDNISTGGMIGYMNDQNTTIENCWYAGKLTTNARTAGGLVGYYATAFNLTINNCLVSGTLRTEIPTTSTSAFMNASLGGFVGRSNNSATNVSVTNSLFVGSLEQSEYTDSTHRGRSCIGQFFGQLNASNLTVTVTNSYGLTTGGGICGWVDNATINGTTHSGTNGGLNGSCQKTLDSLKVSNTSLGLNANVWKDTTTSAVLLLNGNEDDRVRLDITWYDPTVTATTTYTLNTKEQLYGLSYLNNHRADGLFSAKTICLGADITVNNGTVDEWKVNDFENVVTWQPVGTTNPFRGSFNGNGHTISGLYINGAGKQSLFGNAYDSTIEDFKLVNSYIKSSGVWNASVAGNFRGTVRDVYSDVIIDIETGATSPTNYETGGIVARLDNTSTFENCWYAGDITTDGSGTGGIVGICATANTLTIKNCLVSGILTAKINDTRDTTDNPLTNAGLGGLVGKAATAGSTLNFETSLFTGWIVTDNTNLNGKSYSHVGRMLGQLGTGTSAGGLITKNSYCVNNSTQNVVGYIDSGLVNLDGDTFSGWNYAKVQTLSIDNLRVDNTALGLDASVWQDVEDDTPILVYFKDMVQ